MQPWEIALLRGLGGAAVLAGGAFFGQLATGASARAAGIAAGVSFFGYLALRGGVEGALDQGNK
jgi:hypothetical protein